MTCRNRPAPISAWVQEGIQGASLSNPGILTFIKHDATSWMGKPVESGASTTITWDAVLKRYCRNITPGATTQGSDTFQIDIEPKALIDPIFPPTGIILTVQDLVKVVFAGPFNAQQGIAFFGIGHPTEVTNTQNPWGKIGFRCYYPGGGVQPTWIAYFNNMDGTALYKVDSGVLVNAPHLLKIELDGALQQVRWWIDGVLITSLYPAAGTGPGESGLNQSGFADPSTNFLMQWYAFGGADGLATIVMQYSMSGLPNVTEQFSDI